MALDWIFSGLVVLGLPWSEWRMIVGDHTHGLARKGARYQLWRDGEHQELTTDCGKEFHANGEAWFLNNRDLVRASARPRAALTRG